MSIKGYVVPVAVIVGGITLWGFPKMREQVREIRHAHAASTITITRQVHDAGQEDEWCREYRGRERRGWYCEVREYTVSAPAGRLDIDAGGNGGINVEGWDRSDVLIRAKVQARARDTRAAEELVSRVQIETSGDEIRARGPKTSGRDSWSTSFRVSVPDRSDLSLRTVNGGIGVERVTGDIEFRATNGGVSLIDVGGGVTGRTTNGGIEVALAGDGWRGSGLDVKTTNGGIELMIPELYNAILESGTTNGHLAIDFPITVQGKLGRRIRTQLGDGGPLVRAITTNGGVEIRRR